MYYVAEAIYFFLIFFFCYTAANKLVNLESFRVNLIKTSLFDTTSAYYFSFIVIFIELITVTVLIINKYIGMILFLFVISMFTIYISYLKHEKLYEVCGCGGILNGLEYKYHFIINLFLLFGSIFSLYVVNKYEK